MPNGAVGLAATGVGLDQLEPNGEIRGRDRQHVSQSLLVPTYRGAVALPSLQLGEGVEHASMSSGIAAKPLELCPSLGGTLRERIEARESESNLHTPRIELARAKELLFGLLVSGRLEVSEPEIGVAERIVGGEIRQLLELGLGLLKLIPLEVAEAEHAGGVELLHRGTFASTA
jgi:hypothetical protein